MHFYCIARGIRTRQAEWVEALGSIYLPYKNDAEQPAGLVQLSVRPIQLYEIVFPEDQKDYVLSTINPMGWGTNPAVTLGRKALYKALGCDIPVKPLNTPASLFSQVFNAVDVIPIGLKKDRWKHVIKDEKGKVMDTETNNTQHIQHE